MKRLASTGLPLKALQEADCPLCPKILCYAEDKDSTLLVEEHIAGDSLQHLAAQGKLTEKEATELLLTVASGLALLHAHGIVHRDIKPANLLLEKSGGYRLIDFDSARLMKDDADEDTALLGTKGYAPPEQYGYGQTDGRSDIYSLGMTIRRLLPESYRGFLTPIIRKCTAVDPEARYQSATELAQTLKRRLFFHKIRLPLLAALPPSTVTFAYANNYGKKLNTETLLPALSPGETTDIPIPCGTAFPEGTEGLAIWVQIRLPKTILPQTENYQCLRLDVAQTK